MQLSGVRLPVHLSHPAARGLLLWAQRPGNIDRLLHGQRAVNQQPRRSTALSSNAGSATLSADAGS